MLLTSVLNFVFFYLKVEFSKEKSNFKCSVCQKVCQSERGLKRHETMKHSKKKPTDEASSDPVSLHPLRLKTLIENCAIKLSKDECYPISIQEEFNGYKITVAQAILVHGKLENIISDYNGDADKFYPKFYAAISEQEPFFDSLPTESSLLLGMELANSILAYLTNCTVKDGLLNTTSDQFVLSQREEDALVYLSGYVFGTLYRRLRNSQSLKKSDLNQTYMTILLSAKCEEKLAENARYKFVSLKDRGGLWKVNRDVVQMFRVTEIYFRKQTAGIIKNMNTNEMISFLIKNCTIQSVFKTLYQNGDITVKKELAFNLLEYILTLYLRVRMFSYAKDIKEKSLKSLKKTKKKSLRKELKQSSQSTDPPR